MTSTALSDRPSFARTLSVRITLVALAAIVLQLVRAEKADFIVSGGYGHSRLGEWIFGGVTQELLASSPVCCMLSH